MISRALIACVAAASLALHSLRADESLLERLDRECTEAVAKARPGIVQLMCETRGPQGRQEAAACRIYASGIVWNDAGVVVTAAHALPESETVYVVDGKQRRIRMELIGRDERTSIAVLKAVGETGRWKAAPRGDSKGIAIGSLVFAVGNAHGFSGSAALGCVSGKDRTAMVGACSCAQRELLQTTAPINPGDCGGALVNVRGEVVGVLLSSFNRAPSADGVMQCRRNPDGPPPPIDPRQIPDTAGAAPRVGSEAVGFAVPIHRVESRVEEILRHGKIRRIRLGLVLQVPEASVRAHLAAARGKALLVRDVAAGGPAERAGVRKWDLLIAIEGRDGVDFPILEELVEQVRPGQRVKVTVWRQGEEKQMEISAEAEEGGR